MWAPDITLDVSTGKIKCEYCQHIFEPKKAIILEKNLKQLKGQIIGLGAKRVDTKNKDVVTIQCKSCGAEVVMDVNEAAHARCHWCRNTLYIDQQISNGAIPDVVLPFAITKEEAKKEIEKFVKSRNMFAHPIFKKEFTTENIMGVYLPYMIIDVSSHAHLKGQGEHLTRKYEEGSGDKKKTYYDADVYAIERDFDLEIDGLTIASNKDKMEKSKTKTNNVINAIMPFDIENCVEWNANYLKGYTSEKRDINVEDLTGILHAQAKDIARHSIMDSIKFYNRGVKWTDETLDVKGEQWKAAYLPVWLYSYQQVKGNTKVLHYVAVNARTKETMGSVPINMTKLLGICSIIMILALLSVFLLDTKGFGIIVAILGFSYFLLMYNRYRNVQARHTYEKETKTKVTALQESDVCIEKRKRVKEESMIGANHFSVHGDDNKQVLMDMAINTLTDKSELADLVKKNIIDKH